jgi:glutaredoxin
MSSGSARRCPRHDLAAAPDGQCVLCRREQPAALPVEEEPAAVETPRVPQRVVMSLLAASLAAAIVWPIVRHQRRAAQPMAAAAVSAPHVREPVAERAQPESDSLQESLKKLERAEAKRLALENQVAADQREADERERERRELAEAARKREESARDAQRHIEVKRDLEAQSRAAGRRNVSVTMYSTSWCPSCQKARSYLQSHAIPFTELDVEQDAAARSRQHQLNPRGSVPTIAVDDEVLIGWSPSSFETQVAKAARRRSGSL